MLSPSRRSTATLKGATMQEPKVTEISALSAHRREVALVRWSLVTAPTAPAPRGKRDFRDPLRAMDRGLPRVVPFPTDW
jgi:hypothetical protein